MTTRKRTPGGIPASALAANIAAGATSLTLTTGDGANWPSVFPFDIIVNRGSATTRERITVGGRASDTLNSLTRGIDGTTAQAHNLGDSVEVCVAGSYLDELGQLLGGAAGDLYYYDGTALQKLAKGTAEKILKQGASAPTWAWGSLPIFATTAARTTANGTPADGDASYINAGDATEGPEFYNGTSWRKPWNMPWGVVDVKTVTAAQNGISTTADITGLSSTFTAVANRRYRYTLMVPVTVQQTATGIQTASITDGSNVVKGSTNNTVVAASQAFSIVIAFEIEDVGPSGLRRDRHDRDVAGGRGRRRLQLRPAVDRRHAHARRAVRLPLHLHRQPLTHDKLVTRDEIRRLADAGILMMVNYEQGESTTLGGETAGRRHGPVAGDWRAFLEMPDELPIVISTDVGVTRAQYSAISDFCAAFSETGGGRSATTTARRCAPTSKTRASTI
jgi:hypothetical protein